jgi:hypothetical protein
MASIYPRFYISGSYKLHRFHHLLILAFKSSQAWGGGGGGRTLVFVCGIYAAGFWLFGVLKYKEKL